MSETVAAQLAELRDLKDRVDADLEAAELLSLTGAAIGPRYPKLLNAKEVLDKAVPELEAILKEVGESALVEGGVQQAPGSADNGVEKRVEEIVPSSTLEQLRSLESTGILRSSLDSSLSSQQREPEPEEKQEMSPEVQAAVASFERVYGASKHPSYGAYGMVPDQRTRDVWGSIPVAGEEVEE